jgi:hypothetical protein
MLGAASPAAAAYGFWYGGYPYRHAKPHKTHGPKAADHPGKEAASEVPKGPLQIFISINQQKLHLYGGGVHVADTSIATGVPSHPTPFGVFSIIQKQVFHRSNIYSNAPMPYMQRVTWSGVAMHEGQNIGHPASHGCIRLPHDFAVRLYRLTRLGARVIIARAELRPADFADAHLLVHKEKPPEIAAPAPALNGVETASAKPAELASGPALALPIQVDAPATPAASAVTSDQKAQGAASPADSPANAEPTPPAKPDYAVKVAAAKKSPISIFVSRKRQRLYVRQDFEPLFDVAVTVAQPDASIGTHVFTALEYIGAEHTALRWNVVSLPGEPLKRVRYVEERSGYGGSGRARRREIVEERAGDPPPPQNAAQALARIGIPPELADALAQLIVPGSSLIVSDQGLGDETGEGTDFVVVTR